MVIDWSAQAKGKFLPSMFFGYCAFLYDQREEEKKKSEVVVKFTWLSFCMAMGLEFLRSGFSMFFNITRARRGKAFGMVARLWAN